MRDISFIYLNALTLYSDGLFFHNARWINTVNTVHKYGMKQFAELQNRFLTVAIDYSVKILVENRYKV